MPLTREAAHADEKSQNGGEQAGEREDQQGVEQSDDEGRQIGRVLAIADQCLRNIEAGGTLQETEAGFHAEPLQVGDHIGGEHGDDQRDADQDRKLDREAARSAAQQSCKRLPPAAMSRRRHAAHCCVGQESHSPERR